MAGFEVTIEDRMTDWTRCVRSRPESARRDKEETMIEENEKRVRAFYEATVPGHHASLRGLQAPHVVYDLPEGMPHRLRPF